MVNKKLKKYIIQEIADKMMPPETGPDGFDGEFTPEAKGFNKGLEEAIEVIEKEL